MWRLVSPVATSVMVLPLITGVKPTAGAVPTCSTTMPVWAFVITLPVAAMSHWLYTARKRMLSNRLLRTMLPDAAIGGKALNFSR